MIWDVLSTNFLIFLSLFLLILILKRIRTKWHHQSPHPNKIQPSKQPTHCLWRVEYNKAIKQSLFNVSFVCSNKAWLGCLVWAENALFEVMHMWCDSLQYIFVQCSPAPLASPASAVYLSWALWESSAWGILSSAVQLSLIIVMLDIRRATGVNLRPLCFCRTG